MPEGASIAAIVRHGDVIMPSKSVKLALNDHLIFFLEDKNLMEEIEKFFKES
jgi:trk system potassium uptake protein TrkA